MKLFPFGILPGMGKQRKGSSVVFGSLNGRLLAITIDMLLLMMVLMPIGAALASMVFPGMSSPEVSRQASQYTYAAIQGAITWTEAMQQWRELQMLERLVLDCLLQGVLSCIVIVFFWRHYAATPGMMFFGMFIVKDNGQIGLTLQAWIWRYLVTLVSLIPILQGYLLILFDKRYRALQDRLSHTVVLKGEGWIGRKRLKLTMAQDRERMLALYRAEFVDPPAVGD